MGWLMVFLNLELFTSNKRDNMNWKTILIDMEQKKNWDAAISFMQDLIARQPNDMEAYMAMNYLLMNLLIEENHDESKHDHYERLALHYFRESYSKYSDNAEYLFFTGLTAGMSEWYFGIEINLVEQMIKRSMELEPNNDLYQWAYYGWLDVHQNKNEKQLATGYAHKILDKNSFIHKTLENKGALGAYLLEIMSSWSRWVFDTKKDEGL